MDGRFVEPSSTANTDIGVSSCGAISSRERTRQQNDSQSLKTGVTIVRCRSTDQFGRA